MLFKWVNCMVCELYLNKASTDMKILSQEVKEKQRLRKGNSQRWRSEWLILPAIREMLKQEDTILYPSDKN